MYTSTVPVHPAVAALPVESRTKTHILDVSEYSDGTVVITIECPRCQYTGYTTEGRVCSVCNGLSDITTDDLEEIASLLDLWG